MPLDGVDGVAGMFGAEIAPQAKPVDQRGELVETARRPEPMFSERSLEGDPASGDTDEARAGDGDTRDGRSERRVERVSRDASAEDDGYEQGDEGADQDVVRAEDQPVDDEGAEDDGQKYEVTVDGKPQEISLREALNGYVRQATFHQRMQYVAQREQAVLADEDRLKQGWALWHQARKVYEQDVGGMMPKEPNWDEEFARDPRAAHEKQKVFQALYGKLAQSQQLRAQQEQADIQERDRQVHRYAVRGFEQFVMSNAKLLPDERSLKNKLRLMHRTASGVGFSENEVATVYDPRMLTILLKASEYDRQMADKPKAIIPGKGKTLTPGAATPLSGNARRSGFDEAQRRLAQSGKLEDAADVIRRMF